MDTSPLQNWKLPRKPAEKDRAFVLPTEDQKLMACEDVALVRRLFFGAAAREGIRRGRLVTLSWQRCQLDGHGRGGMAIVPGKPNKPGVHGSLHEGTAEAFRRWRRICPSGEWVFPTEALPGYVAKRAGLPPARRSVC